MNIARISSAAVTLTFALLAGCVKAGVDADDFACKFHHRVQEIGSFAALPAAIQEYLKPKFNFDDPHMGGIAPKGGKWNASDAVSEDAPFRRFMRAGHTGNKWFLWWERGGIAYWREFAVFALDGGKVAVVAHANLPSDNPCTATEAALDGKLPAGGETPW